MRGLRGCGSKGAHKGAESEGAWGGGLVMMVPDRSAKSEAAKVVLNTKRKFADPECES
jgi:hypothetical protein